MATLFFSYSHKDEPLRDELETHLAMLKRDGSIEAWHDRKILDGDVLDHSIDSKLEAAEVELNERVYRLFDLTPVEIKLLEKEVEH